VDIKSGHPSLQHTVFMKTIIQLCLSIPELGSPAAFLEFVDRLRFLTLHVTYL